MKTSKLLAGPDPLKYTPSASIDFVVPAGQTWNVESIDADGVYFNGSGPANSFDVFIYSFNVFIYTDNAGLPGTQIFSTTNQPWVQNGTTFTVNLSPAAVLSP